MNNYIEELMKAAKVEIKDNCLDCPNPCEVACNNCCNRGESYPAFTPAKQLELIKLLAERMSYGYIGGQIDYFTGTEALVFDEAIAQIISNAISSKILDKSEARRILSK